MTSREYFVNVLNAHISEEMDATSTKMLERLDAKNAKRKASDSKEKVAARERRQAVLDFLCDHQGNAFTRDDIAAELGISPGQVSAACKSLVECDAITKSEVKVDKSKRVAYTYPVEE